MTIPALHTPRLLLRPFDLADAPEGLVGAIGLTLNPEHQRGELGYWAQTPERLPLRDPGLVPWTRTTVVRDR